MTRLDRTVPPEPGTIVPFEFPDLERRRLDNGLTVIAARHGALPVVTAALVVDAGEAAVSAERAGLARLTVHCMEVGTRTRSAEQVAWELERRGVELELEADWDAAALGITLPAQHLDEAFAVFAELGLDPAFPEPEVRRLRDQQRAAILQRRKDPRALASDLAGRFLYASDSPYARPLTGTAASVQGLGRDEVVAFHERHYGPSGAALLVVGDIEPDAVAALAEDHFGDWRAGRRPTVEFGTEPGPERTTVFVVDRPGSVQSEIRAGHVGVHRHHPDYFALVVMNTLLGGAFTSRLNMNLRERHGFTYGARSRFAFRRRPGPFLVQTAVATDVTAPAVREIVAELRRLREDGATEDEVAAARDFVIGVMPLQFQTTGGLATRLADLFVHELPDDYFSRFRERIAEITPDDVRHVAREHIRPDRLAIVVVGDAGAVIEPLERLEVGPVERHAAPA